MPNYCYGRLRIQTSILERFQDFLCFIKSDESEFDFNRVIPMPDYIYRGNLGSEEREKYGANNWYDWSCINWGTKWNAVDVRIDGDSVYFWTAWSPCSPVILALSKAFPDVALTYYYLDEGGGFSGIEYYSGGYLVNNESYDHGAKHIAEAIGLRWDEDDEPEPEPINPFVQAFLKALRS